MTFRSLWLALVLVSGVTIAAGADGAGGILMGRTMGSHPLALQYDLPSNAGELVYFGGYGYGTERHGVLSGGFGIAILDRDSANGVAGGVGGFITGLRLMRSPVHVALVSWTGVGGIFAGRLGTSPGRGYVVGFEEVDLEIGLRLSSWFMPCAFVGYQLTGNLVPGRPLQERVTYAPVAGVRVAWGRFR